MGCINETRIHSTMNGIMSLPQLTFNGQSNINLNVIDQHKYGIFESGIDIQASLVSHICTFKELYMQSYCKVFCRNK